jgi:hypothetical protein
MGNYRGIDYSGPAGTCNRDPASGIRYGIIPQHDLDPWITGEDYEPQYTPSCPSCGKELKKEQNDRLQSNGKLKHTCGIRIRDGEQWPEEADAWTYDQDGIKSFLDDSGDAWFTRSPFYTHAQFCSPCAPGACHLSHPVDPCESNRAFCPPHDWFECGVAPYPVFSVESGKRIHPEISAFFRGFLETMLWVNDPQPGHGEYHADIDHAMECIPCDTLASLAAECKGFESIAYAELHEAYKAGFWTESAAGGDFYLTRNRHGAGFWDKGYGDQPISLLGKKLTDHAHTYGSTEQEDMILQGTVFAKEDAQ